MPFATRRRVLALLLLLLGVGTLAAQRVVPAPEGPITRLGLALRKIGVEGRALYVTAHPDDEDNRLLAWLGHGRGIACTLHCLTRGEGGQNAIGGELFEALGVLRSEEHRSARRFDGAEVVFGRAFEFGYSFSVEETFAKWGKEPLLRDLVALIRRVRPQVIFTMPAEADVGGQHHQASARLAREAFTVAASDRWPELGAPHAADRLFEQVWGPSLPGDRLSTPPIDQFDPLVGATWRDLGFRARAEHKCQETGQVHDVGGGLRARHFRLVLGEGTAEDIASDPFGGLAIHRDPKTDALRADPAPLFGDQPLDPTRAAAAFRRLTALRKELSAAWHAKIDAALAACVPVLLEARADVGRVAPGDTLAVRLLVRNDSVLDLEEVRLHLFGPGLGQEGQMLALGPLAQGDRTSLRESLALPADARPLGAMRLEREAAADRYPDSVSRALPRTAAFHVRLRMKVGAHWLDGPRVPIVHRDTDPSFPVAREDDVVLLPKCEVAFEHPVLPVRAEDERSIDLQLSVRGAEALPAATRLQIATDDGRVLWEVAVGDELPHLVIASLDTADLWPAAPEVDGAQEVRLQARLRHADGSTEAARAFQEVRYPHIRRAFLERPARVVLRRFPLAMAAPRHVGWVVGTGDPIPEFLARVGQPVTLLDEDDLLRGDLSRFEVIVTGVRAYRVREDLKQAGPRLRAWMEAGGHLLVLYNKTREMNSGLAGRGGSPHAPYPARVGDGRVTDETAPVRALLPEHPVVTTPNRLLAADWKGWVQERGLYFLEAKDERYEELLEMADPFPLNAVPQRGSLVSARVGEGRWTYVGLSLFRQFPAGVPGAYRLFANLLALD